MRVSFDEFQAFVARNLQIAEEAAGIIKLSENKAYYSREAQLVADIPRFASMKVGFGVQAWAAILFVDLRNSSARAEEHGARTTYLTMHTYLPAMAFLVGKAKGHIVGFRGDGLFAAFGLDDNGKNPDNLDEGEIVRSAIGCAKAMMEAIDDVVEPALVAVDQPGDLRIGVGIDIGKVVITRIGLWEAHETTAYGSCVNKAARYSDRGNAAVVISERARRVYPKSETGRMRFRPHRSGEGFRVVFPSDYRVIRRAAVARQ